ncbi:MAG: hypothetical protein E7011_02125 [Alphaproteobacteria bacterium]|nr:hypothetical protein [Alphaproteobacteria bacterium]
MDKKWDWLPDRIKKCGFTTNLAFANAIAWAPTRLSEMIKGTPVNGGKIRNFPQDKIPRVAELLRIPVNNLMAYNNDWTNQINLESGTSEAVTTIDSALLVDIIDAIDEFLSENCLTMSSEQRKQLVKHFSERNYQDPIRIKEILSGMLAINSAVFTRKDR